MSEEWQDCPEIPEGARGLVCQVGVVERVSGESAFVRLETPGACAHCSTKGHCLTLMEEGRLIEVRNSAGVQVGQHVEVGVRARAVLDASILFFLLPAVFLLAGIFSGYVLADYLGWQGREWLGLGIGAAAFVLVFVILKLMSRRLEESGLYDVVITRTLNH